VFGTWSLLLTATSQSEHPTMSGAYGVAFPTAAASYAPASPTQQQVQIQPGSITYTTSATSDGRIQYNQFRYAKHWRRSVVAIYTVSTLTACMLPMQS
jgi:hypothetical protein